MLLQSVTHQLKQEHSSFEIQIPDINNNTVLNRASCLLLQFTCEGGEKKNRLLREKKRNVGFKLPFLKVMVQFSEIVCSYFTIPFKDS